MPGISQIDALSGLQFYIPGDPADAVEMVPPGAPGVPVPPVRIGINFGIPIVLEQIFHACLAAMVDFADIAQDVPDNFDLYGLGPVGMNVNGPRQVNAAQRNFLPDSGIGGSLGFLVRFLYLNVDRGGH